MCAPSRIPAERLEQFLEQVGELNPDAIKFDGFDAAIIGCGNQFTKDAILIYDEMLMVDILIEQGMTVDEAWEYLSFNTWGAWLGESTPIVMRSGIDC